MKELIDPEEQHTKKVEASKENSDDNKESKTHEEESNLAKKKDEPKTTAEALDKHGESLARHFI